MTTPPTDLRNSLHRVADAAEPLPVDDDLWQRGVAARRRGQAFVVAAVLAIVVVGRWRRDARAARTARRVRRPTEVVEGGAIPRRSPTSRRPRGHHRPRRRAGLGGVHLGRGRSRGDHRDRRRAAPARPAGLGPGHRARSRCRPTARGSPTRSATPRRRTTLAVVDLETGRSVRAPRCTPATRCSSTPRAVAGRPRTGCVARLGSATTCRASPAGSRVPAGATTPGPGRRTWSSVAVADDGSSSSGACRRPPPVRAAAHLGSVYSGPRSSARARFSPDGRHVALRSRRPGASYTFDAADGELLEHPFPDGTFGTVVVRPLGWLDDRLQVLLVQDDDGGTRRARRHHTRGRRDQHVAPLRGPGRRRHRRLAQPRGRPRPRPRRHVVAAADARLPAPAERDISWIIGLGVAAAIAVLLALRWLWRRFLG